MNEKFDHIEISLIDKDIDNHRLVNDTGDDNKLEASIKENGVQQPIKVNKKPDGRFTLVFGFRREAIVARLGLPTIPAIIVEGLGASQIRALQAIENLERKELHPLEEARFCEDLAETLMAEHGGADAPADFNVVEQISQRIGRSKSWVDNRLCMVRLSDRVKQAFIDNDIHLQHVHLIARLAGHESQEEVLGMVKAHVPMYIASGSKKEEEKLPAKTVAETRRFVEARLRDLSAVPWKLAAVFDGKPACNQCPHNSANRLELFSDDAPKKAQCLLASCYAEKTKSAGRAVQRATNTALKNAEAPTAKTIQAAMAERDVEHLQPAAVKLSVARRQAPDKPTAPEKRGQCAAEKDRAITMEFNQRIRTWRAAAIEGIDAKVQPTKNDAVVTSILLIMRECGVAELESMSATARPRAIDRVRDVLALLRADIDPKAPAHEHPLVKCVQILADDIDKTIGDVDNALNLNHWNDDPMIDILVDHYQINVGAKPTRKAVEAELYPQLEKPKAKAKAKTKAKANPKKATPKAA